MELTTSKIENIITQISELSTIEKEKIFDYFEDKKNSPNLHSKIKSILTSLVENSFDNNFVVINYYKKQK